MWIIGKILLTARAITESNEKIRISVAKHGRLKIVFQVLLILFYSVPSWGATSWNYRTWSTVDDLFTPYCSSVEFTPNGNILVNHGHDLNMSILDGFGVRWLPSPGNDLDTPTRVLTNETNQLWANYPGGIQFFQDDNWEKFPISEIKPAWETLGIPLAFLGSKEWIWHRIPFFAPSKSNNILVLNATQVIEFDIKYSQKYVLKQVQDTGLGLFLSIRRAYKGGYLITGINGLGKMDLDDTIQPALINWHEFLFTDDLSVSNLGPIYEFQSGQVFGVTLDNVTQKKGLLELRDGLWRLVPLQPLSLEDDTKPIDIWPGVDNSIWYYLGGKNQLIHNINQHVQVHEFPPYHDIAMQPNGIFWLATDWVNRFAPQLWQVDNRFQAIPVLSYLNNTFYLDPQKRFWIIDRNKIHRLQDKDIM